MKRLVSVVLAGAVLSGAGLVYAQVVAPPAEAPPPIDDGSAPPESLPDPLGALLEEAPPAAGQGPIMAPIPDQALTAQENQANALANAEAAELVPEDLPPPPPPPAPLPRPRKGAAVIRAIDKVTAETLQFEAKVGQPVRYKSLIFTVRACETTAEDEDHQDQMAHLEVTSQPRAPDGGKTAAAREIFRGWTYVSSPALNPFEHPVYDAWLIACKA